MIHFATRFLVHRGRFFLVLIFLCSFLIADLSAQDMIQIRRQGFVYDLQGKKVHKAFMEMRLIYKENNQQKEKQYQTISNDEGLYFFNIFLEIKQQDLLAISIHWKNFASKYPSYQRKYSPGFNPYWEFTKEYLDRPGAIAKLPLTFVRDIRMISMENPIPNSVALQMAKRHAPILVFDKGKDHLPTNLEKFYHNHTKEQYKVKSKDKEGLPPFKGDYLRFPDLAKFKKLAQNKESYLYAHVRPLPTFFTGQQTGRLEDFHAGNYWYGKKTEGFVISYWFWYDRAEGPSYLGNSHQGDWQGFAVLLDKNKKPLRILTIGHGKIMVDTSWQNINSVNGHPILYVASGFASDGTNVTIPSIPVKGKKINDRLSIGVKLQKNMVDWFGFAKDKFPKPGGSIKLLIPSSKVWGSFGLMPTQLGSVWLGAKDHTLDWSKKIAGSWQKLILWEEPGWVNQPADKDPDGHHKVPANSAFYMNFNGRVGRHPFRFLKYFMPQYIGQSPMNVPFEINENNIFTREYPRKDRSHFNYDKKSYGPFWQGNESTPQIVK